MVRWIVSETMHCFGYKKVRKMRVFGATLCRFGERRQKFVGEHATWLYRPVKFRSNRGKPRDWHGVKGLRIS